MSLEEMSRIQRFRAKKKESGQRQVEVYLSEASIALLDQLVSEGVAANRSEAIEHIIKNRKG